MNLVQVAATLLLLSPALAIDCPVATCQGLAGNLCARVHSGQLEVNTNSCDTGYVCSVASMLDWWEREKQGEFYCVPYPIALLNTTLTATCGTRAPQRNFKAGLVHIDCQTDQDCIMEDDTVAPGSCQCSLRSNGMGLCVPDISSASYDLYWNDCAADGLKLIDTFNFWSFYMSMWIYLQEDIACTSYLAEVDTLTTLYIYYQNQNAQSLVLAAILLIGN